ELRPVDRRTRCCLCSCDRIGLEIDNNPGPILEKRQINSPFEQAIPIMQDKRHLGETLGYGLGSSQHRRGERVLYQLCDFLSTGRSPQAANLGAEQSRYGVAAPAS